MEVSNVIAMISPQTWGTEVREGKIQAHKCEGYNAWAGRGPARADGEVKTQGTS